MSADVVARFWSHVDRENGPVHPTLGRCHVWTASLAPGGYGRFYPTSRKPIVANRFALALKLGRRLDDDEKCLHLCDTPPCCNQDHLAAGSTEDNNRDCAAKGRTCRGESRPGAKLTAEAVAWIHAHPEATGAEAAAAFGVSVSAISHVRTGKKWRHLLPVASPSSAVSP